MHEKQILKVKTCLNDDIVNIVDSPCLYIDEQFYATKFHEDKQKMNYKSFPVDMQALRVGWIINSDEGRQLL